MINCHICAHAQMWQLKSHFMWYERTVPDFCHASVSVNFFTFLKFSGFGQRSGVGGLANYGFSYQK